MLDRYIALKQKGITPTIQLRVQRDENNEVISRNVVMTWTKYDPETGAIERQLTESIDAVKLRELYRYSKLRVQAFEEIAVALGVIIN